MAGDNEDPLCFVCGNSTFARAPFYLWCPTCRRIPLCSTCVLESDESGRCNKCKGTGITIHRFDTIKRVAIGIRSFDTPINKLLRALEFLAPSRFTLRTFWFSEFYMTHFILIAEDASGEWLQLQRLPHKELKTKGSVTDPGGVQLKPTESVEPYLAAPLSEISLGSVIRLEDGKEIIIVEIKQVEIERTRLNEFQETQGQMEYNCLTHNCQRLVYDFCVELAYDCPDRHLPFEFWARNLQDRYRFWVQTLRRRRQRRR